jgi:NAD(P)-dependent dehydrogenase (short-subunit alcohol dehydrogenase family)
MEQLNGKTAFVTGGAGGLGLAMAQAFVRHGMNVMIADIDQDAVRRAVEDLAAGGAQVAGATCDVADRASVEAAARRTIETFGKVHVVCSNAGVGVVGPIGTIAARDWDWIVDVNLKGVIHGVEVFLPLLESHGEGGHFVNTGSMSSLVVRPGREPYAATKFAILALSEGWALQLAPRNIGVSVLCPGYVQSGIGESGRARQERYGGPHAQPQIEQSAGRPHTDLMAEAMPAGPVGERVVEAIKANELYVITHPEMKPVVAARFDRILRAFDRASNSAALSHLPKVDMPAQDYELARQFDAD